MNNITISDYISKKIKEENCPSEYFGVYLDDDVERILKEANLDIEITEFNPNLCKFVYPEIHCHDAQLIAYVLKEKLTQYKEELEAMKYYIIDEGRCKQEIDSSWGSLPYSLMWASLETIKENIDPWLSMIEQTKNLAEKFEKISV